jgi:hypothetical protein
MTEHPRLRVRHVLVNDGVRGPGWYVVDTSRRPAVTVRGPVTQDRARQLLAVLTGGSDR